MGKNQANLSGPVAKQSKRLVKTRQIQTLVPTPELNGGSSLLLHLCALSIKLVLKWLLWLVVSTPEVCVLKTQCSGKS